MRPERPRGRRGGGVGAFLLQAAQRLFPGYFAFVMATGVLSIACDLLGFGWIAVSLVAVAWIGYVALWVLTLVRLAVFPGMIALDLSNHQRAPGFFTSVAGTCVLGTQTAVVVGATEVAVGLWYLGLGLWAVVMYAFFTAVTIREDKPTLAGGINGAWLIAAVATQSLVVLKATLGANVAPPPGEQFACLAFFMIGCMLYLAIIPLIFYRLTFVQFSVADFGPPYWINMGAAAITTLAGSLLVLRGADWPVIAPFLPMVLGLTVFFYAAASWWIPFLISLMLWRYLVRRDVPRYEAQLWGMVFPLGMYTTCTLQMAWALDLPFLLRNAEAFVYLALFAWGASFAGLVMHVARDLAAARS